VLKLAPITGTVFAKKKSLIIKGLARPWPKSLILRLFFVLGLNHQPHNISASSASMTTGSPCCASISNLDTLSFVPHA
jgi:hypothetical protein